MNKQIRLLALLLLFLLSISACGRKESKDTPVESEIFEITATVTPTATEEPAVNGNIGTVDLEDELVSNVEDKPAPTDNADKENQVPVESNLQPEATSPIEPETEGIPPQIISPESVGHTPNSTTYEQYLNMSGQDQLAYIESFDSVESFVAWFNAAQADYEAVSSPIEVTTGVIDFGNSQNNSDE